MVCTVSRVFPKVSSMVLLSKKTADIYNNVGRLGRKVAPLYRGERPNDPADLTDFMVT